MKRFKSIFAVLILLMLTITPPFIADAASAASSRTVTIQSGQALFLEFNSFIQTRFSYEVKVISGPNIDVIFTDDRGYESYNNPFASLWYYPDVSRLNTRSVSVSDDIQGGHFYIIIDNSMRGTADSNGQAVTVSYSFSTSPGPLLMILYGVIAALIIGVIIWYAFRWSRKRWDEKHATPIRPAAPWTAGEVVIACPQCGSPLEPWYNACLSAANLVRPGGRA